MSIGIKIKIINEIKLRNQNKSKGFTNEFSKSIAKYSILCKR